MRHLRWLLLSAALAPWCFLALGETPKKSKNAGKKSTQPADLQNLPEPERRAFLLEKFADDRRKKQEEKQKDERSAALKSVAKLEASLKSASPDEKPAILYELGVTHLRVSNAAPALRYFRQLADGSEEWAGRARIHLFDLLLYENHALDDAGSVVHVRDAASVVASSVPPGPLLSPRQTADKLLSPEAIGANLAARRALVEFLKGNPPVLASSAPAGNSVWNALAQWKPLYPEVLDEQSDAAWLVRLTELHFTANDHSTAISLANAVLSAKTPIPPNRKRAWRISGGRSRLTKCTRRCSPRIAGSTTSSPITAWPSKPTKTPPGPAKPSSLRGMSCGTSSRTTRRQSSSGKSCS